jgi:hypothetical protein
MTSEAIMEATDGGIFSRQTSTDRKKKKKRPQTRQVVVLWNLTI